MDSQLGACDVCGQLDLSLTSKYYYYHGLKCLCHSPEHFEIVRHCKDCIPSPPKTTTVSMIPTEHRSDENRMVQVIDPITRQILLTTTMSGLKEFDKAMAVEVDRRNNQDIIYKTDRYGMEEFDKAIKREAGLSEEDKLKTIKARRYGR